MVLNNQRNDVNYKKQNLTFRQQTKTYRSTFGAIYGAIMYKKLDMDELNNALLFLSIGVAWARRNCPRPYDYFNFPQNIPPYGG
jgi:hypothetical protein